MPLVITPGHYQSKLRWRLDGDAEEMIATLGWFPKEVPPAGRVPNDVAEAVYNAWLGAFAPDMMGPGWHFVGVDIQFGDDSGGNGEIGTFESTSSGAGVAGTLPQNCAVLVRKRTAIAGKSYSGRMYLPAAYLPENVVGPTGIITPAHLGAIQDRLVQFLENMADESEAPGAPIASLEPRLFHTDPAKAPTAITALQAQPIIATQRRRLRP